VSFGSSTIFNILTSAISRILWIHEMKEVINFRPVWKSIFFKNFHIFPLNKKMYDLWKNSPDEPDILAKVWPKKKLPFGSYCEKTDLVVSCSGKVAVLKTLQNLTDTL
jgi:hypothetical protein